MQGSCLGMGELERRGAWKVAEGAMVCCGDEERWWWWWDQLSSSSTTSWMPKMGREREGLLMPRE